MLSIVALTLFSDCSTKPHYEVVVNTQPDSVQRGDGGGDNDPHPLRVVSQMPDGRGGWSGFGRSGTWGYLTCDEIRADWDAIPDTRLMAFGGHGYEYNMLHGDDCFAGYPDTMPGWSTLCPPPASAGGGADSGDGNDVHNTDPNGCADCSVNTDGTFLIRWSNMHPNMDNGFNCHYNHGSSSTCSCNCLENGCMHVNGVNINDACTQASRCHTWQLGVRLTDDSISCGDNEFPADNDGQRKDQRVFPVVGDIKCHHKISLGGFASKDDCEKICMEKSQQQGGNIQCLWKPTSNECLWSRFALFNDIVVDNEVAVEPSTDQGINTPDSDKWRGTVCHPDHQPNVPGGLVTQYTFHDKLQQGTNFESPHHEQGLSV